MRKTLTAIVALSLALGSQTAVAEEIDFDRPEAWALKYFSSVSVLTPLSTSTPAPGEWTLALETSWIPSLDEDQRRVGFNGTKVEDLNKLPVLPRPRARVGLPAALVLDVAYVPPLEVRGVKGHILSLGLTRELARRGAWSWSLRAHGQVGRIEGDYTCTEEQASQPPGSEGNLYGCEAPSSDVSTLNHLGLAVLAARHPGSSRAPAVQMGVYATYNDLVFQVDAITYGYHDRTRLETDGMTYAASVGLDWTLDERWGLAVEAFYSPLDVVRPPSAESDNDGLFNLRAALGYRFK